MAEEPLPTGDRRVQAIEEVLLVKGENGGKSINSGI